MALATAGLIASAGLPEKHGLARREAPPRIDPSLIRSGDMIFRKGQGLASRAVLAADPDSAYSHVGVLYRAEGQLLVVHAVPGDRLNEEIPIQAEELESFISPLQASAVTIRRLRPDVDVDVEKVAAAAFGYSKDAILFDSGFSLESTDRMYCTELVWRAYREAGIDLVNGQFDSVQTPFGDGPFILPSSLLNSPYLVEVQGHASRR